MTKREILKKDPNICDDCYGDSGYCVECAQYVIGLYQEENESLRDWKHMATPFVGRVALSIENAIMKLEKLHKEKLLEDSNGEDVHRVVRLLKPLYEDKVLLFKLLKENI